MQIGGLAAALEAHVEARALPASPRLPQIPEADDPVEDDAEHLGDADGQSFMIEYIDAAGHFSSRRISVWSIAMGRGGVPVLKARCHERRATRDFRVDRIQCCIDHSGEVHEDVPHFLAETLGISETLAGRTFDAEADRRWRGVIAAIRHEAILLAAMSRSDGLVHPLEIDEAVHYLARTAENTGPMLSDREIGGIAAHLRRLRPNGAAIGRALEAVAGGDAGRVRIFLMAAVAVLDADGRRHPVELELLNSISLELTGVAITAG